MQASKVLLTIALAGAGVWSVQAQPASPELQAKAVELLRQTISQERHQGAQIGAVTSAPASASASADQQQRAIQLLRQKISEENAASSGGRAATGPAATGAKTAPLTQPGTIVQPAIGTDTINTPTVAIPTGPKSKQQRLNELLEQYRADKLTPAQYHAERAKILAEP
jgi:hypothetical protein